MGIWTDLRDEAGEVLDACGADLRYDAGDALSSLFWLLWFLGAVLVLVLLRRVVRGPKFPWVFMARVSWVCDGDSVWVRTWYGRRFKLRLLGIDAPESEQEFGEESTRLLRRLIAGERITVHVVDRDIYGRLVSALDCRGTDVSLWMIEQGAAWPYYRYLNRLPAGTAARYRDAAKVARSARRGLWRNSNPETPWSWRERHRSWWSRFVFWVKGLLGLHGR
ncbi:thermonuclease family protein [Sutterella sp.]|uniref:thermonuclease family protein n=1 Tax=Sutterella sp. TaxID=1981025 RepID=UPI003FD84561